MNSKRKEKVRVNVVQRFIHLNWNSARILQLFTYLSVARQRLLLWQTVNFRNFKAVALIKLQRFGETDRNTRWPDLSRERHLTSE